MYKIVDINDFVCLRYNDSNIEKEVYIQLTDKNSEEIDRIGAFAIKQIPYNSSTGKNILGKKVGMNLRLNNINFKIKAIYDKNDLLEETINFFEDMGMSEEASLYKTQLVKRKNKNKR